MACGEAENRLVHLLLAMMYAPFSNRRAIGLLLAAPALPLTPLAAQDQAPAADAAPPPVTATQPPPAATAAPSAPTTTSASPPVTEAEPKAEAPSTAASTSAENETTESAAPQGSETKAKAAPVPKPRAIARNGPERADQAKTPPVAAVPPAGTTITPAPAAEAPTAPAAEPSPIPEAAPAAQDPTVQAPVPAPASEAGPATSSSTWIIAGLIALVVLAGVLLVTRRPRPRHAPRSPAADLPRERRPLPPPVRSIEEKPAAILAAANARKAAPAQYKPLENEPVDPYLAEVQRRRSAAARSSAPVDPFLAELQRRKLAGA